MNIKNLNLLEIPSDGYWEAIKDYSTNVKTPEGVINVHFRDLEQSLVQYILRSQIVLGAVAWLTNHSVLDALARVEAQIVVQKEDFLRPDSYPKTSFKSSLRRRYSRLKNDLARPEFPGVLGELSVCHDPSMPPVMCMGNHNSEKSPAFPRMHNKFLVFAERVPCPFEYGWSSIRPLAVWTGSFNVTHNATNSMENAIYTTIPDVVSAYFEEYQQIVALAEHLDWTDKWVNPEWRIGT